MDLAPFTTKRMKKLAFLIILTLSTVAQAQVNVYCGNASGAFDCQSTSGALTTTRYRNVNAWTGGTRPSVEMSIDNSNNDIVFVQTNPDSPSGLLSILSDNKGVKSEYKITANGARYLGISRNADDVILLGDVFGKITVNVSGYVGSAGRSASQMCLTAVDQGFFGEANADDTLKAYRTQNQITNCDQGMLDAIALAAPANFCPAGYQYRPDLSATSSQSFTVNRRKFMNECAVTAANCVTYTHEGCIDNGGTFYPGFIFKTIIDLNNETQIAASCPVGYRSLGPTQEYPCPHNGDDPNCTANKEDVICSTESCPDGVLKKSFDTTYGATITREPGETGSFGGKTNLFVYDADLTDLSFANGSNGSIGLNDMATQTNYKKYCVRILDNNTSTLDANSPERNTPTVNLHSVTFIPIKVLDPSGLPNLLFPVRSESEAIGVYKKMDSSVRSFIFKNIIQTAQ